MTLIGLAITGCGDPTVGAARPGDLSGLGQISERTQKIEARSAAKMAAGDDAEPRARSPAPEAEAEAAKAVHDFHAFALNFLLLPLLDDDGPGRWADFTLSLACDDADVWVDGAPPQIGAPVPTRPFAVEWRLNQCSPMQGPMALSGTVTLQVTPGPNGYTARVSPAELRIASAEGIHLVRDPFTAHLEGTP